VDYVSGVLAAPRSTLLFRSLLAPRVLAAGRSDEYLLFAGRENQTRFNLLSVTRLPLLRKARGFAPPPRGEFAFIVGVLLHYTYR
jgi:hypothetical protein